MKGVVAFAFFMLFLAAFALVSLSNRSAPETDGARPPNSSELVGNRWRVAAMRGAPATTSGEITVQFTQGGMLTGSGTCQHFAARYQHEGPTLTFTEFETTPPAGCDSDSALREQALLKLLSETAAGTIDAGNLVLLSGDNVRLVRFAAVSQQ